MRNGYRPGDYLVVCDLSGFECYASQTRKTWDGKRVRWDFWEPRQPQDFVRSVKDDQSVPDPRPRPADTFLSVNQVVASDL